jgi:hypothetical protein
LRRWERLRRRTACRDRDTAALFAEDTATGQRTLIAEDARADIGGTLRHTTSGVVQAWSVTYLNTEWHCIDEGIKSSLDWLRAQLEGDFGVASRTDDDRKWLVWNDPLTAPIRCYIYDRETDELRLFYVSKPALEGAPLQPMQVLEIPARDGLVLPSYLTLPAGSEGKAVPLVLVVHGGPWARDGYGFNRTHQWLANRGYAVLSVNFRGYRVWELPPSNQGIAALEMLRILEPYDLKAMGHNSPAYLHHLIEAKKLAYADLDRFVGDADHLDMPAERMLTDEFIAERRSHLDPARAQERVDPGPLRTQSETVYLSVADAEGNMVSFINSVYDYFGSGVVVPGTGFALHTRGAG